MWCVIVEVKGDGANILKESDGRKEFQYISVWIQARQLDVNLTQISTDPKTQFTGVFVKGKYYYTHNFEQKS